MDHPVWIVLAALTVLGLAGAVLIIAQSPEACIVVGTLGLAALIVPWGRQ